MMPVQPSLSQARIRTWQPDSWNISSNAAEPTMPDFFLPLTYFSEILTEYLHRYSFFFLEIKYGYCFSQPSSCVALNSEAVKPLSSPSFIQRYSFSVLYCQVPSSLRDRTVSSICACGLCHNEFPCEAAVLCLLRFLNGVPENSPVLPLGRSGKQFFSYLFQHRATHLADIAVALLH